MKPHTWTTGVMFLLQLAKEMKEDRDQCLILDIRYTPIEAERDLFLSLIPDSVPPTARAVIERDINALYNN